MELKLKKANIIISKLDKSKTILKRHIRILINRNKKLTEKLRTLEANQNFRKVLNDDQIITLNKLKT